MQVVAFYPNDTKLWPTFEWVELWLCYGYESYIVGKVLTRAIFRCMKMFGDVSGCCVIVFFSIFSSSGWGYGSDSTTVGKVTL